MTKSAAEARWLSLAQMSREVDRSPAATVRLLNKWRFAGFKSRRINGITSYDARSLEMVKAFLGQPHRVVQDRPDDWLEQYTKNGSTDDTA